MARKWWKMIVIRMNSSQRYAIQGSQSHNLANDAHCYGSSLEKDVGRKLLAKWSRRVLWWRGSKLFESRSCVCASTIVDGDQNCRTMEIPSKICTTPNVCFEDHNEKSSLNIEHWATANQREMDEPLLNSIICLRKRKPRTVQLPLHSVKHKNMKEKRTALFSLEIIYCFFPAAVLN